MLKDFFNKMFSGDGSNAEKTKHSRSDSSHEMGEGFYYEYNSVSNRVGGYCKTNVYLFKDGNSSFCRCIVDENGLIQNFPGFEDGSWKKDLEYPLINRVMFNFDIHPFYKGKAYVEWTLQPDGRYFEDDDGFGAEDCEEIILYSYLDTNGNFTEPFKHK